MAELEREKFEAWARPQLSERDREIVLRWDGAEYQQSWAQMRWERWLARSESAPADLRRAWEQGRGNTKSVVFEYGSYFLSHYAHGVVLDEIDKLEYPGESTPTTPEVMPKMLDRARQWLEKHVATVESDQVAHFMAGFANDVAGEPGESAHATPISHDVLAGAAVAGRHEKAATADPGQRSTVGPEDIQGEAGSPAPAPTYVGVDFGRGKDATGYHCSVCGDSLKPCEHWVKFEAAPAPTEEK